VSRGVNTDAPTQSVTGRHHRIGRAAGIAGGTASRIADAIDDVDQ